MKSSTGGIRNWATSSAKITPTEQVGITEIYVATIILLMFLLGFLILSVLVVKWCLNKKKILQYQISSKWTSSRETYPRLMDLQGESLFSSVMSPKCSNKEWLSTIVRYSRDLVHLKLPIRATWRGEESASNSNNLSTPKCRSKSHSPLIKV